MMDTASINNVSTVSLCSRSKSFWLDVKSCGATFSALFFRPSRVAALFCYIFRISFAIQFSPMLTVRPVGEMWANRLKCSVRRRPTLCTRASQSRLIRGSSFAVCCLCLCLSLLLLLDICLPDHVRSNDQFENSKIRKFVSAIRSRNCNWLQLNCSWLRLIFSPLPLFLFRLDSFFFRFHVLLSGPCPCLSFVCRPKHRFHDLFALHVH